MPIVDLGYRRWDGRRSNRLLRPLAITATSLQLVWRGVWLRRLLLLAWLPAIPMGIGFFLYEQSLQDPRFGPVVEDLLRDAMNRPDLAIRLAEDPVQARHDVWALMLLSFFRYPQAINIVLVFGLVAPRIISYDLRSRAHLLYFSRPLTVAEYLLGKALVLVALLVATVTIPALAVYLIGLSLSPDTSTILQTWDLPLRILLASISLAIPTAAVAILYSSFTSESRYASFAWFATWILGWVTYGTLSSGELMRGGDLLSLSPQTKLVSPYHTLGEIQAAIFGVADVGGEAGPAFILVIVITFVAMMVAYQRVAGQLSK
jgi:ABC-type transport system involved in multi-copper enzyme maturation permease subunit